MDLLMRWKRQVECEVENEVMAKASSIAGGPTSVNQRRETRDVDVVSQDRTFRKFTPT